MIIYSIEMEKFIPSDWKFKPFDLKLINNLARNHPYQKIMFLVYKYYCSYDDEVEGDRLNEIDYFKLLDRYYRYGIGFNDSEIYFEDSICVQEDTVNDVTRKYLVNRKYELKILLFNNVKRIRLRDIDKGKVSIWKIEKWKREVVNQQTHVKSKLKFLHPNVYHSLINFVFF